MSSKIRMENEKNEQEEEYLNKDRFSKIEMYTSVLNNNMEQNNNIEQTEKQKSIEYGKQLNKQLIELSTKKIIVKRVILIVMLFLSILILLGKGVAYSTEKLNVKEYYISMNKTHTNIIQLQEEKAESQRIKAEEEMKAKLANRNTKDFTPEQIEKVKHIYNSSDKKIAYLTFDDGPSSNVTPLILDVLKKENIKATFFVLGTNATWNAEILKRIRTEGHYIANHGYSHKYDQIYKDYESLINDYNLCEQSIRNSLGEPDYKTRIFRFPGGSTGGKYAKFKKDAKVQMQGQNITYLDWNALTCDAEGVPTKESILTNLKNTTEGKKNIVVLMHDLSTKILTYETLMDVINYLRSEEYEFGDIYDLIGE